MATRLVATRPLALNLDVDTVRGALGRWFEQAHESGLAARRLAIAMATTHLRHGHDVIVPQLLTNETFVLSLEAVANATNASFIEIALIVSSDDTVKAFVTRSASPQNQQHQDALALVEQAGGTQGLAETHARLMDSLDIRPDVCRVEVTRGDIEATLRNVESAIATNPRSRPPRG